mmetsp:Transcript_17368/g.41692  ORF Transcript_17368/g.41692 Transcript_17368/m.41692 type:complete len:240 (+) Transcript_17368:1990-2709(+)
MPYLSSTVVPASPASGAFRTAIIVPAQNSAASATARRRRRGSAPRRRRLPLGPPEKGLSVPTPRARERARAAEDAAAVSRSASARAIPGADDRTEGRPRAKAAEVPPRGAPSPPVTYPSGRRGFGNGEKDDGNSSAGPSIGGSNALQSSARPPPPEFREGDANSIDSSISSSRRGLCPPSSGPYGSKPASVASSLRRPRGDDGEEPPSVRSRCCCSSPLLVVMGAISTVIEGGSSACDE